MNQPRPMTTAEANAASAVTAARQEAYRAAYKGAYDAAFAKAAADERKRVGAILTSTQGKAHPDLAKHLAFETNMTADEAMAMLGKTPKAAAGRPRDRLDAALAEMGRGDGADADGAYGRGRAIVARVKGRTGNDN